ncbi:hypothetical protein K2173_016985 [Erythroxylum novogranatense]|uniref:Pentatricopeptide repeat-containing protein n=1 Tax=Erythroxylum novogranatense TaxID=1862640 RepID=A0AAV8U8X7_9ROSI|nr:hypothetical protein K2173_016985 [Erythroxylum novogranatense]
MTLYMPLFSCCKTLRTLIQLHAHLLYSGFRYDPQATTKLIESYAQMGSLQSARLVFETFKNPDPFMWGVLIKCHVWSHFYGEALSFYKEMLLSGTQLSRFIFPSVLRACAGLGDLGFGAKVHGRIIKSGYEGDDVIETSLLVTYGELGCRNDARKVFDYMPTRDLVSWSTMISCYVDNGEASLGMEMFRLLGYEGFELDSVTMLSVVEACSELRSSRLASSVHGYILQRRIETCGSLDNSLIVMYSKCDDLYSAERIFMNVDTFNVTSCTAMISSYNRSGRFRNALEVFFKMLDSKVEPNAFNIICVLGSCSGLGCLREGKSAHCYAVRRNMDVEDDYFGPALVELYSECGNLGYCEKFLHANTERNVVSWNMLMSVYNHQGLLNEALLLFVQMHKKRILADSFSLSTSISACGDIGSLVLGNQIHGHAIKRGFLNEFVLNALIDMYSKCGCLDKAYSIFDDIKHKSIIAWNSMICGFSHNGNSLEAIKLFDEMCLNHIGIDEVTLLCAVQACSQIGNLRKGKWIHHKLIVDGIVIDPFVDTALIDMYCKCGDLRAAQRVFHSMSERSVVSWSAMISGYGMNGAVDSAIACFAEMVNLGIKPNSVTFTNILAACSHSGYVEEGKSYFDSMREFSVEPKWEHFACVVDLLSRSGDLEEAYRIINTMPFPADATIWGAFLNGCRIHQRIDMIERIRNDLSNMITNDTGYYTLLSNIYAEEGKWGASTEVRSVMKSTSLKKVPGYSTIEVDRRVYRFGAGDTSSWQMKEIYDVLENIQSLALQQGYRDHNYTTAFDFYEGNNVENEGRGLATAYRTISTSMKTLPIKSEELSYKSCYL